MIPGAVRASVESALGPIRGASPVSGGCINHATRVDLADGPAFLKYNPDAPPGLFAAEADGLAALSDAASIVVVPQVLAMAEAEGDAPAWLALEWLEPAPRAPDHDERLGRGLAEVHDAADGRWGWEADNFIGPLPQENSSADTWAEFWAMNRLEPQLARARDGGRMPGRRTDWDRLFARLSDLLAPAEEDGPALLHGDLWSGNVVASTHGPALVDPAVYAGHGEVDLAMAELFGGFGARFHAAYAEARPLAPGYPARRDVYQLYYLLVHVNLFGGGYGARTEGVLRRALAA